MTTPIYGKQCARCGTLVATPNRETPLCASCAAGERAATREPITSTHATVERAGDD